MLIFALFFAMNSGIAESPSKISPQQYEEIQKAQAELERAQLKLQIVIMKVTAEACSDAKILFKECQLNQDGTISRKHDDTKPQPK